MASSQQKTTSTTAKNANLFAERCIALAKVISKTSWHGLKALPYHSKYFYYWILQLFIISFACAYRPPKLLGNYLRDNDFPYFFQKLLLLPEYDKTRLYIYIFGSVFLILMGYGLPRVARLQRFQNGLDKLRLGNGEHRPKIIAVEKTEGNKKTKIKINSAGVGSDKFLARKNDLESAFNQTVEAIFPEEGSPQIINITMSKIPLPKLLYYEDHVKDLTKEGAFFIGQSRQGFIVQNIADLPHLLIAGTTGSGKSIFFKQALISLMESTPTAKFYLMDFKRGVEFGVFSSIPNVQVIKTKSSALASLKLLKEEMKSRFDFLEQKKLTKVNPVEHNFPRIILAIDEASELLSVPDRYTPKNERDDIGECRNLVDEIAKLGRAACIHIIIATQKVSKTIISTALQENIGGRMAFRMATLANSAQVLGAKDASQLPEIPGRAIWNFGTKFLEVQVPLLDEKSLAQKIKHIIHVRKSEKQISTSGTDHPLVSSNPSSSENVSLHEITTK